MDTEHVGRARYGSRRRKRATAVAVTTALILTGLGTSALAASAKPAPGAPQVKGQDAQVAAGPRIDAMVTATAAAAAASRSSVHAASTSAAPTSDAHTVAVSADPALQQAVDLGALAQDQSVGDALRAEAKAAGSVAVLVTLNTTFKALGALRTDAAAQQRSAVLRLSDTASALAVAQGGTITHTYDGNIPAVAMTVTPAALAALAASPAVAKIDPDRSWSKPTDAVTTPLIGAADAQDRGFHGAGAAVVIMDTGVEYSHPYLGGRVTNAACFSSTSDCPNGMTTQYGGNSGTPCTYSGCDHGTHVAGIAAGQTVGTHVGGIADQAKIESFRIFHQATCTDANGNNPYVCPLASDSDVLAGLNFAYQDRGIGTASVNLSLGGGMFTANCDSSYATTKTAIDNLRSVNIATVIASGNSGYTNAVSFPACISTATTIGATDNADAVASFSNSSAQVDFYAPGASVESSVPGGSYGYKGGTSMATPQVTGSIAVMKAYLTGLNVDLEEYYLNQSGVSVTDSKSGLVRRRINVLQAIGQEGITLTNDAPRDLRNPLPYDHRFATQTTASYWSAVAIRPPVGADDDLTVYQNGDLTGALASSRASGDVVDFVAQDSNRLSQPAVTYPVVHQYAGTGRYQIDYANDASTVGDSTTSTSMSSAEVAEVRDTYEVAGVSTYYRVVPSNSSQDPELFLMQSTDGTTSTYVQGRASAAVAASANGPGGDEAFVHTSSASQYDGLVLINRSGSGAYTLYRDTSAPTGSMVINEGNPATVNSRSVTLQISASDPQTGIRDMRVAADGTADTEPWVPYATTAPIQLAGAAGVKTVQVQVRDNANAVSTFTDTITLDTRANYRVTSVSNPPTTAVRGGTFPITDTTKNVGLSDATASSSNRYYLSLNTSYEAGTDVLLGGSRTVMALAAGATGHGSPTLTVPATVTKNSYYVIVCADTANKVNEYSDTDNCSASTGKVSVQVADYVVTSVTDPPTSRVRGATFSVTDTTKNGGNLAATAASKTRYYLSVDAVRDSSDKLLTSARAVSALAAGAVSTGSVTVTVPTSGVAAGTYRLLACADDLNAVDESSESNNCKASAASINIT